MLANPFVRTIGQINALHKDLVLSLWVLLIAITANTAVAASPSALVSTPTGSNKEKTALQETTENACFSELDAAVSLASNESNRADLAFPLFKELEIRCPGLPQIPHNQGVIAAQAKRWPEAIDHFKRSLQLDSRAAMTHRHLQQIYEYRAAQAYALALNTPVDVTPLELRLQGSSDQNAVHSPQQNTYKQLHSIITVEYEMFDWWQARQNGAGLIEHYMDGFSEVAIQLSREHYKTNSWSEMRKEIAFTSNDVVVIVSDPSLKRTMLLLQLVGTRWKIYQETLL